MSLIYLGPIFLLTYYLLKFRSKINMKNTKIAQKPSITVSVTRPYTGM